MLDSSTSGPEYMGQNNCSLILLSPTHTVCVYAKEGTVWHIDDLMTIQ